MFGLDLYTVDSRGVLSKDVNELMRCTGCVAAWSHLRTPDAIDNDDSQHIVVAEYDSDGQHNRFAIVSPEAQLNTADLEAAILNTKLVTTRYPDITSLCYFMNYLNCTLRVECYKLFILYLVFLYGLSQIQNFLKSFCCTLYMYSVQYVRSKVLNFLEYNKTKFYLY